MYLLCFIFVDTAFLLCEADFRAHCFDYNTITSQQDCHFKKFLHLLLQNMSHTYYCRSDQGRYSLIFPDAMNSTNWTFNHYVIGQAPIRPYIKSLCWKVILHLMVNRLYFLNISLCTLTLQSTRTQFPDPHIHVHSLYNLTCEEWKKTHPWTLT